MNRRLFLRRAALVTAGVIAGDQLDILEHVGRRFFPGFGPGSMEAANWGYFRMGRIIYHFDSSRHESTLHWMIPVQGQPYYSVVARQT